MRIEHGQSPTHSRRVIKWAVRVSVISVWQVDKEVDRSHVYYTQRTASRTAWHGTAELGAETWMPGLSSQQAEEEEYTQAFEVLDAPS